MAEEGRGRTQIRDDAIQELLPGQPTYAGSNVIHWHGAAAKAIQEPAGHEDLSTTQRYMHFSPKAVESAIRLLDGPAPAWAVED